MGFIQKVKIILQIIFICALFLLNAAVYQKYNYFSHAKHLAYIPSTSVFSITINANRLSGKVLYNFIYKNEELLDILDEADFKDENKGGLMQSGVDLTTELTLFMTNNAKNKNFKYAGLLVDLNAKSNFLVKITALGYKKTQGTHVFKKSNKQYVVCDESVAAFVMFKDSTYTEIDKTTLLNSFIQRKEAGNIGSFVGPYLEKGNDVVLYGLPDNISTQSVLMQYFIAYGSFNADAFDFNVDFKFKEDVTTYFPKHDVNPAFDFSTLDGYMYAKSSFVSPNADKVFDGLPFFKVNDSIHTLLKPALYNQKSTGIELYCFTLDKAKLNVPDDASLNMKLLSSNFLLPGFDFRLYCDNAEQLDTVFSTLTKQGELVQENHWYKWKKDEFYTLNFGVKHDYLSITTKPDYAAQLPQTGYSNVLYFHTDKLNEKLPDMRMRLVADQFKLFRSIFMYSTGCNKNTLYTKGKLIFAGESYSLFEVLKLFVKFKDVNLAAMISAS